MFRQMAMVTAMVLCAFGAYAASTTVTVIFRQAGKGDVLLTTRILTNVSP